MVGVTAFTTIDYPGKLAAVFYTQGCPWKCRYCHNAHLRDMHDAPANVIPWEKLSRFLESRRGFLEGVVFCGGEPTLHPELIQAMDAVRSIGFLVGLHTSGMFPSILKRVLMHCDWVGMDIKAPFALYEKVTEIPNSGPAVKESARLLIESRVPHEFRTTYHPKLHTEDHILEIAQALLDAGARHYAIQIFKPDGCQDDVLKRTPVSAESLSADLKGKLLGMFDTFEVRE